MLNRAFALLHATACSSSHEHTDEVHDNPLVHLMPYSNTVIPPIPFQSPPYLLFGGMLFGGLLRGLLFRGLRMGGLRTGGLLIGGLQFGGFVGGLGGWGFEGWLRWLVSSRRGWPF
jgi:hypothetical protein